LVSDHEANEMLSLAQKIRERVEIWLQEKYPGSFEER